MIDLDKESSEQYSKRLSEELSFVGDLNATIAQMAKTLGYISKASTELNKSFLQNRQRIEEMHYAIADAIPGVQRLGGDISKVSETISDIALASRRNVIANTESVEKLYAAGQVTGKSVRTLVDTFADIGVRFDQIDENLEKSIAYVQSIGGNASEVMQDVLDNTEQLNKFNFANGVQGLTKMAAQASMLRFDMRQTFQLAEDALDPERAVELSSAFQRLGVMSGTLSDPFQLMNQSINDPEGLQNSIVEMSKQFTYFDEKTKSFKINPQGMLTLRELQKQTGLSAAELSKMGLAAAELDDRLSQISPRITFANEEDKQYLSNIASLNEKGEYTVKLKDEEGKEYVKNLSDVTQEEMNKLIEQQKKAEQPLEEIARNQLTVSQNLENDVKAIKNKLLAGLVTAPSIVQATETVSKGLTSVTGTASKRGSGVFEVPTVREYSETFISSITNLIKDVTSGNKSLVDSLKDFGKAEVDLFTKIGVDINSGAETYFKAVKEDLKNKGIDIDPLITEIKKLDQNFVKGSNDTIDEIKNSKTDSSTKTTDKQPNYFIKGSSLENFEKQQKEIIEENEQSVSTISKPETNYDETNRRLSETLEGSDTMFSESMKSSVDEMKKYASSFMTLVDRVKEGQMKPEQIDEWLETNKTELVKYGDSFYGRLDAFSKTFQDEIKTTSKSVSDAVSLDSEDIILEAPEDTGAKEVYNYLIKQGKGDGISDIDKIIGSFSDDVEILGENIGEIISNGQSSLESAVSGIKIEETTETISDTDKVMGDLGMGIKDIQESLKKEMNTYKTEFDNVVRKVLSGEESSQSLTDFIVNNKEQMSKLGGEFSKNMEEYAKDVTGKVKEDEKRLAEILQIKKDIESGNGKTIADLEAYFEKFPDSIERLGLSIDKKQIETEKVNEQISEIKTEGKSSFIEGKIRSSEPIQSGQIQGGQSLTQLVQHKVEFGKITVDVQLPANFSQLNTDTQKKILDDVFNAPDFARLVTKVEEMYTNMYGGQTKQANVGANNFKR